MYISGAQLERQQTDAMGHVEAGLGFMGVRVRASRVLLACG